MVDLPETHAAAGEVRIRVHASTVNPTDTYLRKGARADALRNVPPPYVPGMDVAGVVDEIGTGTATDLAVGDAVMAMVVNHGSHGGYRESIVLPADCVARAPAGATPIEAATLPMNALTARQSLDQLALRPGQTLAVTGAAGCYGGYVVQLAKADGLRVIADASSADAALVRSLGADVVVARGDDIAAQIRKVAPHGVDGLADGSFQSGLAAGAVRDGGAFASVRGWSGNERGIVFHKTSVRGYDHRADGRGRTHHATRCRHLSAGAGSRSAPPPGSEGNPRPPRAGVGGASMMRAACSAGAISASSAPQWPASDPARCRTQCSSRTSGRWPPR
jgi:NADPH:quinone reductase-like Zn-dependent oxidoreductase